MTADAGWDRQDRALVAQQTNARPVCRRPLSEGPRHLASRSSDKDAHEQLAEVGRQVGQPRLPPILVGEDRPIRLHGPLDTEGWVIPGKTVVMRR